MQSRLSTSAAILALTLPFCGSVVAETSHPPLASSSKTYQGESFIKTDSGSITLSRFSTQPQRSTRDGIALGLNASTGNLMLGFNMTMTEGERRYDAGMARGAFAMNLFSGNGEAYSRLNSGVTIDPHFFHGGSSQDFSYYGAAMDVAVTRASNLQFAYSSVESRQLDSRKTLYAGIEHQNFQAGMFTVFRDNDPTTAGLSFSFDHKSVTSQYQQIDHESGARYHAVKFSWNGDHGNWYGLDMEVGRNPLYRDNDDSRILFKFGGTLGRSPYGMNAAETVASDTTGEAEPPVQKRNRGLGILAGTVVALGVAGSSGDDSKDSAIRIRGQNNAARTVLNRINPASVRQNREYGGWVYRNGDGTYGYTNPVAGNVASVDIGPSSSVPGGTRASASYHTHGGPDPRYDNENFSPADILSDNLEGVDGYLGTPAGQFKLHDYQTQRVILLGTISH